MRFTENLGSYPREEIGLHGGMGLNGGDRESITPDMKEKHAPFYEMSFSGKTTEEIIAQIETIQKESGKIATSYTVDKMDERGISVTVSFDNNRGIDHSRSNWGYPELKENQAF